MTHVPDEDTRTTAIAPASQSIVALAVEDIDLIDAEVAAGRQQMNRAVDDLAEGLVRVAFALARLKSSRAYRRRGYQNFGAYVRERYQMSDTTAYDYISAVEAFGPDQMRTLLNDIGMKRTVCLARIHDLDPNAVESLLALPPVDGKPAVAVMTVEALDATANHLAAQLEEAYDRYRELQDELAATQQIAAKEHERFLLIEQMNQELVVARDKAERDGETARAQLETTHQKAAKKRRALEQQMAALQKKLDAANDVIGATPSPMVHEVVTASDPALLRSVAQLCATALMYTQQHGTGNSVAVLAESMAMLARSGAPLLLSATLRGLTDALSHVKWAQLDPDEAQTLRNAAHTCGQVIAQMTQEEYRD